MAPEAPATSALEEDSPAARSPQLSKTLVGPSNVEGALKVPKSSTRGKQPLPCLTRDFPQATAAFICPAQLCCQTQC